jgi:hypothetical protein
VTTVPLFVVTTAADATTALRRLIRDGWSPREGFAQPAQQWDLSHARIVCHGRVPDSDTAQVALMAAARGAAIVAVCDLDSELGQAFLADLRRLGTVGTDPDAETTDPADAGGPSLAPEQRALLDRLAAGETIAAAAAAEFLSLRTANRRIAEAREILGVRTTREAVMAYARQRRDQPSAG